MAAKHTSGPWLEVEPGHIRTQSLQLVAVVQHGLSAKADARLIAAAPDLLAALQQAKNSLVAFKFMPAGNAWEDSDEANLQAVDAAIAKATGGAA